jgi:glycosyltransferase involved in cell wall biosynthesis
LVLDWADWWGRGGAIGERPFGWINRVVGPFEAWLEEASRPYADKTTVISRALEARAHDLGLPPESIIYLPNGCDTETVRPVPRQEARAALGLPADQPLLGHLGVPYPADAELLGEAIRILRMRRPDARLIVLGNLENPKLARLLDTYLPDPDSRITPGFVPNADLSTWLGACDALLLPLTDTIANRGRSPAKVTDYLAAGRAVVATPVGDMEPLVREHEVGVLAAPTPDAFATAAEHLLDDPEQADRLGQNGRRLATGALNWSTIAERVDQLLRDTVTPAR